MALQFRRYAQSAQIFAFDFGGSIRAADARHASGDWHDLGGSASRRIRRQSRSLLQPLARIDDIARGASLGLRLAGRDPRCREKCARHARGKGTCLWSALSSLASAHLSHERTLTGLSVLLQIQ